MVWLDNFLSFRLKLNLYHCKFENSIFQMITIFRIRLYNKWFENLFKQTYFRLFQLFTWKSKSKLWSISWIFQSIAEWVRSILHLNLKTYYTLRANIFSSQFNENVKRLSSSFAMRLLICRGCNSMLPGIPR